MELLGVRIIPWLVGRVRPDSNTVISIRKLFLLDSINGVYGAESIGRGVKTLWGIISTSLLSIGIGTRRLFLLELGKGGLLRPPPPPPDPIPMELGPFIPDPDPNSLSSESKQSACFNCAIISLSLAVKFTRVVSPDRIPPLLPNSLPLSFPWIFEFIPYVPIPIPIPAPVPIPSPPTISFEPVWGTSWRENSFLWIDSVVIKDSLWTCKWYK